VVAVNDLDLDAVRAELEARRDRDRQRLGVLAERPELGSAVSFGKRIGDGTSEAVSRLTDIGVGESLQRGLDRTERALTKLDKGTYGICDACAFQFALDAASQFVTNAGYTLASWINGLENIVSQALDYSCVVEIDNRAPYDLVRDAYGIRTGRRRPRRGSRPAASAASGWATRSQLSTAPRAGPTTRG
jgi:DnaK suppressor protein